MVTKTALLLAFALTALAPCVPPPSLSRASSPASHLGVSRFLQMRPHTVSSHTNPAQHHPAQDVTGSYDGPNKASLDVLQLPRGRIQFDLQAYSHFSAANGPNMGEASGVISLHHGVAVYQDHPDADNVGRGGGTLTLRFYGSKAVVTEQGDLEFGAGVSAGGTYIRHSRKPTKFGKDGQAL